MQANTQTSAANQNHSHEVQEIMTQVPSWIVRWGITALFGIVVLLLTLSWMFKYPDVLPARIVINSSNAPANIVARSGGALKLFINDDEPVEEGELIALIKTSVDFDDIMALKAQLDTLPNLQQLNEFWQLGELQPYFNHLVVNLKKTKNIQDSYSQVETRKEIIDQQIKEIESGSNKERQKVQILQQEYQLADRLLETRYQPLLRNGSISAEDYEKLVLKMMQKRRELASAKTKLNELNNRILLLKKETHELDFQKSNEEVSAKNILEDAYSQIKSQIAIWEQRYLLRAPISGEVNYLSFAKENTFVQAEQEIASIVPDGAGDILGEMFIPQTNAGKVDIGQVVFIELDDYLKREFGSLEGKVSSISGISHNNAYKVQVALPDGLTTNYKKDLEFKHGMQGNAKVVTEDIRLLHRFVYQLRMLWSNG